MHARGRIARPLSLQSVRPMNTKVLALALAAIGAILTAISVLADPLGIGANERFLFGWKQALGTAAGVVLLAVGLALWRRPASARRSR